MTTQADARHKSRRAWQTGLSALLLAMLGVGANAQSPSVTTVDAVRCDPADHQPTQSPGTGCDWAYETGWWRFTPDVRETLSVRWSAWERIPPCACGWYAQGQPCPPCPPNQFNIEVSSTLQWQVTSTQQAQAAIGLKSELLAGLTLGFELTNTEAAQLTGSKTIRVTRMEIYQPIMCFDRFMRWTWNETVRRGTMRQDWTFVYVRRCGGARIVGSEVNVHCGGVVASGTSKHNTPRLREHAPQEPPCGGVIVQPDGDPWGGVRERPCCPTVCVRPPSSTPCCGCGGGP